MNLQKPLVFAIGFHLVIIALFIISFDRAAIMPVLENSAQDKIITAALTEAPSLQKVVDIVPPKIIAKQAPAVRPAPPPKAPPPTPEKIIPEKTNQASQAIAIKKPLKVKKALIPKQIPQLKTIQSKEVEADFAKELKTMREKSLLQQMQQEENRVAAARSQQMQGVVQKYKALILQAISQRWLVPSNINKKLFAELLIRLAPGGAVLEVEIIKSSGVEALDHSARSAVFKASPLPVPTTANEFEPFRQFTLKVKPENILANDNWMS